MKHIFSNFSRNRKTLAALGVVSVLAACAYPPIHDFRWEAAKRIAYPTFMQERVIEAGEFQVLAMERVEQEHKPVTVYLEGDGAIGFFPETELWSGHENNAGSAQEYASPADNDDATPINPVSLHLSSRDLGKNVVWLTRPCQYIGTIDARGCTKALYTTHRYSPQIMEAMNLALTNIKRRYQATSFNVVAYGGGAAVAVYLGSVRDDIATIRTVNGVLDNDIITAWVNDEMTKQRKRIYWRTPEDPTPINTLNGSMNAKDRAATIADIPQHHFVGAWDKTPSVAMAKSFVAAQEAAGGRCTRMSVIDAADFDAGWVDKWPELLKEPVSCGQ